MNQEEIILAEAPLEAAIEAMEAAGLEGLETIPTNSAEHVAPRP